MGIGITVALALEDRVLADRLKAMLRDLGVDLVEPDSDADAIAITDVLPEGDPDRAVILIADDVDLIAALRAGAAGVLPASVETADLRVALAAVLRGLAVVPLRGVDHAERDPIEPLDDVESVSADSIHLTSRESEVLSLLAEGASNKEIARKLGISVHTAKFHVASILEKLDATGRTDAVAHAVRLGLLML